MTKNSSQPGAGALNGVVPVSSPAAAQVALSRLAAALGDAGWGTQLRDGFLHVINRSATAMNERITVSGASYLWSWGERIADLDQITEVVERVDVVLAERVDAGGGR